MNNLRNITTLPENPDSFNDFYQAITAAEVLTLYAEGFVGGFLASDAEAIAGAVCDDCDAEMFYAGVRRMKPRSEIRSFCLCPVCQKGWEI
jgi:hypothetical protein